MSPAIRLATLCALLLASCLVNARMYQWTSQSTGTAQFSGEPPSWYRAEQGGPRVRVFDNGNLVDDTAIMLPRAQREALRTAAFQEAEQRRSAEALKRLEQAARREKRRQREREAKRAAQTRQERERDRQPLVRQRADVGGGAGEAASSPTTETLDDAEVARLKAIISAFDRSGGGLPK